jgi:hypothetical protein
MSLYDETLNDAARKVQALKNDPVFQLANLRKREKQAEKRKRNKPRKSRAILRKL